jgi:hypothetical protein
MPTHSSKKQTPKDHNELAAFIVKEATKESKHCHPERITPK